MSGKTTDNSEPITEINVTPLVDVSLVLVIIFMAVAPFAIQAGIKVLQSKAKAAVGKVSLSESVQIRLDEKGIVTVNGKQTKMENFSAAVSKALLSSKDKFVIVTAAARNRVGDVVRLLDDSKQAGALKLAIMKSDKAGV
ncbi:MAG: biopolymer transporter ExbD [bacterium]